MSQVITVLMMTTITISKSSKSQWRMELCKLMLEQQFEQDGEEKAESAQYIHILKRADLDER